MLQNLSEEVQRETRPDSASPWIGAIGLAFAVGIAYFLAAQLSLALLTEPDGVAVFWPAAGVSSGVLIALGRDARLPVAGGAMVATVIANLMGDRKVSSATAFALCNAGEALLTAWLIERYFVCLQLLPSWCTDANAKKATSGSGLPSVASAAWRSK